LYSIALVVVSNNLLVTLVTLCFVNNGLADKTSTEPGLASLGRHVQVNACLQRLVGLSGASDRQRLAAFTRRSDRSRFVGLPANHPTFADLCHDAKEKMFAAITSDRNRVHHLLPPQSTGSQNYNLRQRTHNLALPSRTGHLTDNNFIQRNVIF